MGASWATFIPRNRILRFSNNSCSIHLRRKKWKCVYNTNPKTTSRKNVCTKTHLYRDHQTAPPSTKPFKMPVNSEMAPWTAWNEWCTTEKYICILFATCCFCRNFISLSWQLLKSADKLVDKELHTEQHYQMVSVHACGGDIFIAQRMDGKLSSVRNLNKNKLTICLASFVGIMRSRFKNSNAQ